MYHTITECSTKAFVPIEEKISKQLPVFYNPAMELNRTISVLLLAALGKKNMRIALPLAGSGVRGIRFMKELKPEIIESIHFNDLNPVADSIIKKNLKLNGITQDKIHVSNKDANLFLLESEGFDYIDIDPFGSPNFLLDSAVRRISRTGIIAVTATDTSALSGTFPKACMRKYFASPLKNHLMHETGLRILIRKCQLIAAQYEKALTPILSYSKEHYMRTFLKVEKGKSKVDEMIKQHHYLRYDSTTSEFNLADIDHKNDDKTKKKEIQYAGPLWAGNLKDQKIIDMIKTDDKFITLLKEELDTPFFYDIHTVSRLKKLKNPPKKEDMIKKLKNASKDASETHFLGTAIKTKENLILSLF